MGAHGSAQHGYVSYMSQLHVDVDKVTQFRRRRQGLKTARQFGGKYLIANWERNGFLTFSAVTLTNAGVHLLASRLQTLDVAAADHKR